MGEGSLVEEVVEGYGGESVETASERDLVVGSTFGKSGGVIVLSVSGSWFWAVFPSERVLALGVVSVFLEGEVELESLSSERRVEAGTSGLMGWREGFVRVMVCEG